MIFDWLTLGIKHAQPVTKVVIGATVLCLATVMVLEKRVPPTMLFASAGVVLSIGLIASVLSRVISQQKPTVLGTTFSWAVSISFLSAMFLFIAAAFFGRPSGGALILARVFSMPDLIRADTDLEAVLVADRISLGNFLALHPQFQTDLSSGDPLQRRAGLGRLPPLVIKGTIALDETDDGRAIRTSRFELRGGQIVTNGHAFTLETIDFVADGGGIASFVNAPATFEQPRRFDVKPVELTVHGRIVGTLPITLAGRSGPNGRPGAAGALGAAQKLPLRPGGRGLMV